MSQVSNVSKINFSTAFLTDKICGILSNTFTASSPNLGGYLYQYTISHSFTRPVFCDALFSANGTTFVPNGQADALNSYNVYSDSSNIYLLTTASSGTIYYKEVSTWIDGYDNSNPLISPILQTTLPTSDLTYFDSRKNYQKIFMHDVRSVPFPGVGVTNFLTINHNLGYVPRYKVFFESLPGQVWPLISGGVQDIWLYDSAHQYECSSIADSTTLNLIYKGGASAAPNFRLWYRIYYDS